VEPQPLKRAVLCLVTAGTSFPSLHTIRDAARAGVDLVQIRERALGDRALVTLVRETIDAVAGTAARVVVNDRVDVALAAGAAGVHLRSDSMAASDVRRLVPPSFIVGRSVHGVPEAVEAEDRGGCDYLVFGTVFESASKPAGHRVAGLDGLERVCGAVSLPVLAIGGVTVGNAGLAMATGAAGVAAIGLFTHSTDVGETVRAVRRLVDTCYPQRK
jgi:thiamine-phosphate pyrophosphorylase